MYWITKSLPKFFCDFMTPDILEIDFLSLSFALYFNCIRMNWIESIGYVASFFVVLSFVLKDIRKIRFVNMIGCIAFVAYGILNNWMFPIIIPNVVICLVQVYYLFFRKSL